ncbi:putative transcription factor interactor and regulator CCHC(Zn) family [Helianthus annuus]|nr:putative transcription factor interactor and regulator CCHC(Zn) family [Helianthus annuus]
MIKVDNVEKWPKLTNVNEYAVWKEEFELVVKSEDTRMWYCIIDGYMAPTRRVEGRTKVISYDKMDESEKLMVDAEKKALAVIKMSLPEGIKHTIKHYGTSYDLWEALRKRYQNSSRQSVGDRALDEEAVAVKEETKKALEQKVEKKAAEVSKCMDGVNELTTEVKVTPEPVSHTCHNCTELQGEVDRLSEQNKILLADLENRKELNVLLIKRESNCLEKLKSNEQEISSLTSKVNELLQIIDLARETVKETNNELSEKCTELADAQAKIVELQGKLHNFGNSSLVRTQIQKGLKRSNDKTGVGFTKASSSDYSFLPTEDELTDFVTAAHVVDPIAVDLPSSPVSLKESVGSNSTPHKVDEDTKDKKANTFKKGSNKEKISCFKCHNKGHVASSCPLKKGKQKVDEVMDGNQVGSSNNVKSESSSKTSNKKFSKKRSCFKCHTKGHVASCCPNKKNEAQVSEEKGSNSPKKSAPKQPQNVAVGVDKAEKGTPQVPRFQRNQQRFQPRSPSSRYQRPRSSSPKMNNFNSNNFRGQSQYQNRYQNNGGRNFYNNGFRNYNYNASWNQNQNFQRSNCPNVYRNPQDQRPSGNQNQIPTGLRSKTPVRSNGYWMDVPVVGEFGRPKTIKAWVPQSN